MGDKNKADKDPKKTGSGNSADTSKRRVERRSGGSSKEEKSAGFKPRVVLASHAEPTYYIGGGNGNAIVEAAMNELGWRRITDKMDDSFKLRWCETKAAINYNTFREGEQLVNHIPNCNLLTNKMGLLTSLQEYSRVCEKSKRRETKLNFIPETYRLDDTNDRRNFLDTYKVEDIWICKPTGRNQGKGIFLVRSVEDVRQALGLETESPSTATAAEAEPPSETPAAEATQASDATLKDRAKEQDKQLEELKQLPPPSKKMNRIVQRYITNPMLLNGKKFDIRCYMLIASTAPFLVLYNQGYIRLSIHDYDNDDTNLIAHLTNQFIQKKDPTYQDVKDETTWSMDKFNMYINENLAKDKGLSANWAQTVLVSRIKQIMTYCFNAVKNKLERKVGYFDLYGLDFMIDEDMKIWLIEVNINPCLATNCAALKQRVPGVVKEAIHLSIECFDKSRKGRALMPLQSLKSFTILHNGCTKQAQSQRTSQSQSSAEGSKAKQSATTSRTEKPSSQQQQQQQQKPHQQQPMRRARSLSPVKESQESSKQTSTNNKSGKGTPGNSLRPTPIHGQSAPNKQGSASKTTTTSSSSSTTTRTRTTTIATTTTTTTKDKQKSADGSGDRSAKPRGNPNAGNGKSSEGKQKNSDTSNKETTGSQKSATKTISNGKEKKSPYTAPVLKMSHDSGKKKSPGLVNDQEKPNRGS